jgi:hypothetical protein
MATRTADPALHFPSLPSSPEGSERLVESDPHAPNPATHGALRGLAFALIFEFLVGFTAYAGWVLLRHLR